MLNKLSSIVLYILFAATVVVSLLFYLGGYVDPNAEYVEPTYTNSLMLLMYAFFAIAAVIVVVTQAIQFGKKAISAPKAALKSIAGIALLVVLLVVTYFMSDGKQVEVLGVEPISETWVRLVDMQLYSAYILSGIALVLMAVGGFLKKIK
jgi:magnesium-transporting ATPase (P-type)